MTTDCIFCRIASGAIPATVVAKSSDAVAFRDLNPQAPTHVLVVPIEHLTSVADTDSEAGQATLGKVMRFAAQVAKQLELDKTGYRLVVNHGREGGQSVHHLHVHLLGGRQMHWPPG